MNQPTSNIFLRIVTVTVGVALTLFVWVIPDGGAWWQENRPDVVARRRAEKARDATRLADLEQIETLLADYARTHKTLPSPKDYEGDDGDNWDVSTKGDFLRFLGGKAPLDPINRAKNDPCNDTNSYGYGYSVTNLDSKDATDRTYIICAQLEHTKKSTERRRSLREILEPVKSDAGDELEGQGQSATEG